MEMKTAAPGQMKIKQKDCAPFDFSFVPVQSGTHVTSAVVRGLTAKVIVIGPFYTGIT